ncbi:MAG TPA: serine/threonine-protein kinase [Polyangiaceae bacterium]
MPSRARLLDHSNDGIARGRPADAAAEDSAPDRSLESGETPERDSRDSGAEFVVTPGTLLGGRYMVDGALGEGGMGVVYAGHHVELGHPVAIKFLRRDVADRPSVVQRFMNEGRSAAALRSEHVVRVMDVGQLDSGRPYLVMEHLDGIDLDALLEREGPLDVDRALELSLQVCSALTEAHGHGIVHRDIKPENLFLVESADRPFVKVLDFGLAKRIDSAQGMGLTGPRDSMGSPYYMSPEQIVHPLEVDARTDIWSLGVVLYRLLTGAMPFGGDTALEVYAHVINAEPVPPTQFRAEIGQELEEIVQKCLRKDVGERYQNIQDLSQDLLRHRVQRQERVGSGSTSTPTAFAAEDDTPITIPGVHSRWPMVVAVLLALGAGALYRADEKGRIDARNMAHRFMNGALGSDTVRNVTDGWLTSPRLGPSPDEPMPRGAFSPTLLGPSAGVFLADRARAAEGSIALPAEREREASTPDGDDAARDAARVELRDAEYQRYLKDNGMVPIKEVLEKLNLDALPKKAE